EPKTVASAFACKRSRGAQERVTASQDAQKLCKTPRLPKTQRVRSAPTPDPLATRLEALVSYLPLIVKSLTKTSFSFSGPIVWPFGPPGRKYVAASCQPTRCSSEPAGTFLISYVPSFFVIAVYG